MSEAWRTLDAMTAPPLPALPLPALLPGHTRVIPARPAVMLALPPELPADARERLQGLGIDSLWSHQVQALDHLSAGTDVVLATGTGSGKSLVYQLAALMAVAEDPRATVLYVAPTKALGHDQARALAWTGLRVGVLDGDTPADERDWINAHAQVIITNPDMLSMSVLPRHHRWRRMLAHLRLVVIDECHTYRGLFGSHSALIFRRLLRLATLAKAAPQVVAASATVAEPAVAVARLTGREAVAVTQDGSPRGEITVSLCPPDEAGMFAQTSALLSDLALAGRQSLAFIPSRIGAERLAASVREHLDGSPVPPEAVLAYRAGLLPEERRAIEAGLREGSLQVVATTNALELGIDISGLDAVVVAGWPGRRAAFWQQAGRAGRAGAPGLAVLVAGEDPLDRYLVAHPEAVFDAPPEAGVIDPDNPVVLRAHLVAAAAEAPLSGEDVAGFGPRAGDVLNELLSDGMLKRRPGGVFWPDPRPPAPVGDIRAIGGNPVQIVEADTGRLLGTVDPSGAPTTVFPGAVYTHQGEYFDVLDWPEEGEVALVRPSMGEVVTSALSTSTIDIDEVRETTTLGDGVVFRGLVTVTGRVEGYQRRRRGTGEILSTHPLELSERHLQTSACWWVLSDEALAAAGIDDIAGAAHAAEHAAIGLLPLFATCDRWDIGGMSTVTHPATGACTVFVYDGHPGGVGYTEVGFTRIQQWLRATLATIESCTCAEGCPSCVQSPKCGNGNEPLDKRGAVAMLELLVGGPTEPTAALA